MRINIETDSRTISTNTGRRLRTIVVCLLGAAFLGYSALIFSAGIAFLGSIRPTLLSLTGATRSRDAIRAIMRGPGQYTAAVLAHEPVEELFIDIKFRNLMKLRDKRDDALRLGILMASPDDLVPASIRHRDRAVPVRIRLKGDYTDHFEGEKWSFRVQTRRGDQLFGIRRFSLQAPRTRGFQSEPLVLAHLRREGVLAPRYFFVNVTVNGRDIGLMALEEHFSKELLESQQRREGVILRFDEDAFFEQQLYNGSDGPYNNSLTARVRPFRSSKIAESAHLSSQLATATGMLRAFQLGELPAADVFDADLFGRFLAVAEVWKALHLLRWHNLRFYFNPLTQRLEPVGFDADLQASYSGPGLVVLTEPLTRRLLTDPEIRAAFIEHFQRLSDEFLDASLPSWLREIERPLLLTLHREFPFRSPVELDSLAERLRGLQQITMENFSHFEPWGVGAIGRYAVPVYASIVRDVQGSRLEFMNTLPVPVQVSKIRFTGRPDSASVPQAFIDGSVLHLPPTPLGGVPTLIRIELAPPAETFGIEASVRVSGQSLDYRVVAEPGAPLRGAAIPVSTREQVLAGHTFLAWNEDEQEFVAEVGAHRVEGSLVLPEGAGLRLRPGTSLRFSEGEALIASGPLNFEGSKEAPVVLEPAPGVESWGGVCVIHSQRPYHWRHVIVRDTTGIERGSWVLTGGVTLRASRVVIENSSFLGTRAEDALNLIRSRFELNDIQISDATSDGFDADYSSGEIHGGRWMRIGGDGVDVAGAEIGIDGTSFSKIADKALSVGEGSHLLLRNARIEGVGTAVASKDRSRVIVESTRISDVLHVALMAYVKKPEYGSAEIIAEGVEFDRVEREAVAQIGSAVRVNGEDIEPETVDVDALYSGTMQR